MRSLLSLDDPEARMAVAMLERRTTHFSSDQLCLFIIYAVKWILSMQCQTKERNSQAVPQLIISILGDTRRLLQLSPVRRIRTLNPTHVVEVTAFHRRLVEEVDGNELDPASFNRFGELFRP